MLSIKTHPVTDIFYKKMPESLFVYKYYTVDIPKIPPTRYLNSKSILSGRGSILNIATLKQYVGH